MTKSGLKFLPIIDQTGTYTYKTAQIIGEYSRPLSKNEYTITIKDTQQFADMIKQSPSLSQDEEYVSYDIESLFTNVPLHETINYIIEEIYINKKLKPMCNKLIFKRLLTNSNYRMHFYVQQQVLSTGRRLCNGWSTISHHGWYFHGKNGERHCEAYESTFLQTLFGWYNLPKKDREWGQVFKIPEQLSSKI